MALDRNLVEKTEKFLRQKFDEGDYLNRNPADKNYRLEHSYRVANLCRTIAQKEGFDETALVIAGLLHDVSYCLEFKTREDWMNHGRSSARIARPFLKHLGLSQEKIEEICYGIAIHVDDQADFAGSATPFAQSVGDADNLDRFDAYRIHEGLQYRKFTEMTLEEKKDTVHSLLIQLRGLREMELGTTAAKEIWIQRIEFYISFYEKLESQLNFSSSIL